jgi:hypothetical protein
MLSSVLQLDSSKSALNIIKLEAYETTGKEAFFKCTKVFKLVGENILADLRFSYESSIKSRLDKALNWLKLDMFKAFESENKDSTLKAGVLIFRLSSLTGLNAKASLVV